MYGAILATLSCQRFLWMIIAAILLLTPQSVFVQGSNPQSLYGQTDFRINDDSGNTRQAAPSVVIAADGSSVVVWYDERNGKADIFGQRFDGAGLSNGANFQVNDLSGAGNPYYPVEPDIAIDFNGNFIIAWDDFRTSIMGQRYKYSGERLSVNFMAHDTLAAHGVASALAMDGNGDFAICWGVYPLLYLQLFNAGGARSAKVIKIRAQPVSSGETYDAPAVLLDNKGNSVMAWLSTTPSNYSSIYGQRFDKTGASMGNPFQISSANTNAAFGYAYFNMVNLAGDDKGNCVVVWKDNRNGNADIYGQRFQADATALGDNFRINDDAGATEQSAPAVAMDVEGNFGVAWTDKRNGNSDVYAQLFDKTGQRVGENFKVSHELLTSNQIAPSLAMRNGVMMVVWQDDRDATRNFDVWANRVEYSVSSVESIPPAARPNKFLLLQNYPNPFNPATTIDYWLSGSGWIELSIFNVLGQQQIILVSSCQNAGPHQIKWDGRDASGNLVAAGIYFIRLLAADRMQVRKMILAK